MKSKIIGHLVLSCTQDELMARRGSRLISTCPPSSVASKMGSLTSLLHLPFY